MLRRRLGLRLRLLATVTALALIASGCFTITLPFYRVNTPVDSTAKGAPTITETFRIGPYDLAPMGQPGFDELGTRTMPRPSGHVAIKRIDWAVVDGNGTAIGLDKVHLHHIVMVDESRPDPLCPTVGTRFAGTGAERTPQVLFGNYAYVARPADVWWSTFHVHTTSPAAVSDVYVQYKIQYEQVSDPADYRHVTPYFLDVTGCWENSASEYDVPGGGGPGSTHVATATYTAAQDGVLVYAGAHIHAGGKQATLTRDATGEDYCTANASYAPGGHPSHPNLGQLQTISWCKLHVEVKAGEQYTMQSHYDNEYPVAKAMGIMLAYVWHPDS